MKRLIQFINEALIKDHAKNNVDIDDGYSSRSSGTSKYIINVTPKGGRKQTKFVNSLSNIDLGDYEYYEIIKGSASNTSEIDSLLYWDGKGGYWANVLDNPDTKDSLKKEIKRRQNKLNEGLNEGLGDLFSKKIHVMSLCKWMNEVLRVFKNETIYNNPDNIHCITQCDENCLYFSYNMINKEIDLSKGNSTRSKVFSFKCPKKLDEKEVKMKAEYMSMLVKKYSKGYDDASFRLPTAGNESNIHIFNDIKEYMKDKYNCSPKDLEKMLSRYYRDIRPKKDEEK